MATKKVIGGPSEEKKATPEVQKICDEVRLFYFCFDGVNQLT